MVADTWVDIPEYVAEVESLIAPLRDTSFYEPMRFALTDIAHFDYFIDAVRPYIDLEGKTILDSGCGTAGLCLRLLRYGPAHVTGIELDARQSQMASSRVRHIERVDIINDDASLGLLPPASFDMIFSLHVIEHVIDARRYVSEMASLLRPGGLLFLACPHRVWPFEAHTQLPLINYLPRGLAKRLALALARLPRMSAETRRRLETSTLYEHDFTHFDIKRLMRGAGLDILEQDHPRFWLNELLGRRWYAAYRLAAFLDVRWQWYLSALFSQNINAICRKPA